MHHFQNNTISTKDHAAKLRPLMDNLQRKFIQYGGFPEYVAINESMIPYFGKHFAKQFIWGKPIRLEYKMWALCSNRGYLHLFDLYMGKKRKRSNQYCSKHWLRRKCCFKFDFKSKSTIKP